MTNHETAERLVEEAGAIAEEMEAACQGSRWNLTVRRAQEVVELSLKGLLKALGLEYPRVHDVGDAFVAAVAQKGVVVAPDALSRIRQVSSYLARDRAPAFYLEADFSAEQAQRAQEDAQFVLRLATDLARQLQAGPRPGTPPTPPP
ncbi:MAG: HEPN domain-containing protein [Candidatus Latescibacterota bacterium]